MTANKEHSHWYSPAGGNRERRGKKGSGHRATLKRPTKKNARRVPMATRKGTVRRSLRESTKHGYY